MDGVLLAAGLLCGGALGFALGARPGLLARLYRSRRLAGGSFKPVIRRKVSLLTAPDGEHAGHGHPAYQDREDREAQDVIDYLYPLAVAFFAGFVFTTLVPDALTHSRTSLTAFISGAGVMGALSKWVFKRDPCCEGGHDHRGFGFVSLIAMGVCSLNDGLLLGLLDPAWYSGLNIGMVIHKITSAFAIAQVLKQTRFRGGALYAFGAFSVGLSPLAFLATRTGWLAGLPDPEPVLAFSAGLLAWVTLASLVPHARAILRRRPRIAYGCAAALTVSIGLGIWHTALHRHAEGDAHAPAPIPAAPAPGAPGKGLP